MSVDRIEVAESKDVGLILTMILEFAEFEGCVDEVEATEALLLESLFGPKSVSTVLIAYVGHDPVGYMIYCPKFTSFTGRNEWYLQNVYLRPSARGHGLGKALMSKLASIALEEKATRLEWFVEESNAPALSFYESLGAVVNDDIRVVRLQGEALSALARLSR